MKPKIISRTKPSYYLQQGLYSPGVSGKTGWCYAGVCFKNTLSGLMCPFLKGWISKVAIHRLGLNRALSEPRILKPVSKEQTSYTLTGSSLMIKLSGGLDKKMSKVFQFYEILINNKRRAQHLKTNVCVHFAFLYSWWKGNHYETKSTFGERDYMESGVAWFPIIIHTNTITTRRKSQSCIDHLCWALRLTFTTSFTNPGTQDEPKQPCELGIIVFILQLREQDLSIWAIDTVTQSWFLSTPSNLALGSSFSCSPFCTTPLLTLFLVSDCLGCILFS